MRILLLYFFLNKYFSINIKKVFRIIKGLFISLFYLIEYISLFILNINFFYFLILYKYLIKEKFFLKEKIIMFNKKIEKKSEKKIGKTRTEYIIDRF
jgi:hypothetical protein